MNEPQSPKVMTPEQAAWVREVVWHPHHRKTWSEVPALYSMCACQLGPCGHCVRGAHGSCSGRSVVRPAAYLTTRRGSALTPVWELGHHHVWRCSCSVSHLDGASGAGWHMPTLW